MSQTLLIERVSDENLELVWPICTEIAQTMEYPSFFCSGDWLKIAAESLHPEETLLVLAVKIHGTIKALLPLVFKRNALGGMDLHFLGTDFYPDPVGLICAPSDRSACAAALQNYLFTMPGWDRLILDWVLAGELADWNLAGLHVSAEPYRVLRQSFTDLLGEFRKKKRYNLRAMVRKVLDAGGSLVRSFDQDTHPYFLEALFELHKKRGAERSLESTFSGPRVEKLHRRLIDQSEKVRFYGLELNKRLIAVVYGFEFGNRYFYYQVAHDPEYGELSPGSSLLFLVVEDCCSRELTEFNFLQGNESYKSIWTDESRDLYRITLKHGTWRSHLFAGLGQAKMALKRAGGGDGN